MRLNAKQTALLESDPVLRARWESVVAAGERQDVRALRRVLPSLLTESAKTVKSLKVRALTGIMYMSPADESGVNVCPFASHGCRAACLGHSSGRMGMVTGGGLGNAKRARILRTWAFLYFRTTFLALLTCEIVRLCRRARRKGMRPFVRLNGTSDLRVESWGVIELFPWVQFYDYTKDPARAERWARGELPENYHLTFSRSETNDADTERVIRAGGNVAVVFAGRLPKDWRGRTVVDGDETDARPDDRRGVYVGLTTKGPLARKDRSGFIVRAS